MHERDVILDTWRGLEGPRRDAVLVTVVHVTGSAYRHPGARMLILPGGGRVGTVSGGCLESEVIRKAWWFTESGLPVVRTYDTTSDADVVREFGLGCAGVVQILLERITSSGTEEMLTFLQTHRELHEPAVVATVVHAAPHTGVHVGDRLLVDEDWIRGGALVGSPIESVVRDAAAAVMAESRSRFVHLGDVGVFVEWIAPPLALVVFGAGDDAVPLVTMAAQLGWRVTVADGRPAFARPSRFPGAVGVVPIPVDEPLRHVAIDGRTAVVVMTHNYPQDLRLLPSILETQPKYLGLLGPRSRAERLFRDIGLAMPDTVHAPVGLDIGGDHPAATALSILAEVQAATSRRAGGMLRLRADGIHQRVPEVGSFATTPASEVERPAVCGLGVGTPG